MRAALLLLFFGACRIHTDPLPTDAGPSDLAFLSAPRFADALLSLTAGGAMLSCADRLPKCGGAGQTGECLSPAVGVNDGASVTLSGNDVLVIGFLCSFIRETGPSNPGGNQPQDLQSADFKIWSTVPAGSTTVVSASEDGTDYVDLVSSPAYLHESNQQFDLAATGLSVVRFLRISANGTAGVAIDAVEAY